MKLISSTSAADQRVNVAVIGAGWVAGARHLPALSANRRCRVLGVVDRCAERALAHARRFKVPFHATSCDAPWLDEVEAVTVAVAPMAHYEIAREMLSRGKHVLLEKPLTLTVAQGEALAALAAAHKRVLAVVHNFQFARSARAALAAISAGRWGRVTGVHAVQLSNPRRRLPEWCEELPWGLFYDESPHFFYLLGVFGGSLHVRQARVIPSRDGRATPALVHVEFDCDRGTATLSMNFEAPVSEWHVMVFTERGLAVIDLFRDILLFAPNDGRHRALEVARSSWSLIRGHLAGFWASGLRMCFGKLDYGNREVVERFLEAVLTNAPLQSIGPVEALDVLRLQHRVFAMAGTDRANERPANSFESAL